LLVAQRPDEVRLPGHVLVHLAAEQHVHLGAHGEAVQLPGIAGVLGDVVEAEPDGRRVHLLVLVRRGLLRHDGGRGGGRRGGGGERGRRGGRRRGRGGLGGRGRGSGGVLWRSRRRRQGRRHERASEQRRTGGW